MNRFFSRTIFLSLSLFFLGAVAISSIQATGIAITGVTATATGDSSAHVTWITSQPSRSRVFFGVASGIYSHTATVSCGGGTGVLASSHCIVLTNLQGSVTYFYQIESTAVGGTVTISPEFQFYFGSASLLTTTSITPITTTSSGTSSGGSSLSTTSSSSTATSTVTSGTVSVSATSVTPITFYPSAIQVVTSDSIPPTIILLGNAYERVERGSTYYDPGITVSDNAGNFSTYAIINGQGPWSTYNIVIDTDVVGIHTIEYHAVDSSGNRSSAQRTVEVFESSITTDLSSLYQTTTKTKLYPIATISKEAVIAEPIKATAVQIKLSLVNWECQQADITDPLQCDEHLFLKSMPNECKERSVFSVSECDRIMQELYISSECRIANISDIQECRRHMEALSLPFECRQAGLDTKNECADLLFAKHAPQVCLDKDITNQQDCEVFIFSLNLPEDCRAEGITNPEACKRLIIETYGSQENIPPDRYPEECKEAGAQIASECFALLEKNYTPKECQDQGIISGSECATYLRQKYLPQECRAIGITDREECNRALFEKYAPEECRLTGITTETECREFFVKKFTPQVTCRTTTPDECRASIKKHIGSLVAIQKAFAIIRARTEGSIESAPLDQPEIRHINILPLKITNIANIRMVKAKEAVVVREDGTLVQVAPIVWVDDSDGDGLPNDVEKRLGTDPDNADSDQDGIDDREELKARSNPLGKGDINISFAPIDSVLINDVSLEHPKVSGPVAEDLIVENVSNVSNKKEASKDQGYLFKGKADPHSVVTLYIYSEVPLVVTVSTDRYGNWQYQLDQPMSEGEHEVYVAVNDSTGKVVKKSNSFNFFVQEAQAFSVNDFVASSLPTQTTSTADTMNVYLLVVIATILIAIFFSIIVVIYRDKFPIGHRRHGS